MSREQQRADRRFDATLIVFWIVFLAGFGSLLMCAAACATAEALAETPEAYWIQTWALLEALLADVLSIVEWIL